MPFYPLIPLDQDQAETGADLVSCPGQKGQHPLRVLLIPGFPQNLPILDNKRIRPDDQPFSVGFFFQSSGDLPGLGGCQLFHTGPGILRAGTLFPICRHHLKREPQLCQKFSSSGRLTGQDNPIKHFSVPICVLSLHRLCSDLLPPKTASCHPGQPPEAARRHHRPISERKRPDSFPGDQRKFDLPPRDSAGQSHSF